MGPKSRHRSKTPAGISNFGTLPSNSTSSIGMGKKASIAKSNLYSTLLPILNHNHLGSKARNQNHKSFNQNAKNQIGWLEWSTSFLFPSSSAASSSSDPERKVIAHWDPLTNLVYVPTDELELARKLLWQRGFFGKGNLSRSEPTWKEREQGKEKVRRVREKGGVAYTPEELTALRRKERQAAKIERARLAVRAGTQLPDGIVALGGELQEGDLPSSLQGLQSSTGAQIGDTYGEHIPGLIYFKPPTKPLAPAGMDQDQSQTQKGDEEDIMSLEVEQLERFVLSREETFFLAGMMDCLEVRDQNDVPLSLSSLYALLLHSSLPLSIRGFSHLSLQSEPSEFTSSVKSLENSWARPDNPFLLHYIAYHYFRSLGWVVRSGSKFCVDWLLYKKGPVFGHAEFAVLVIPVYSDPRDEESSPFLKHPSSGERSWVWFSSMNRVNSQVQKTLILCHVHIPPLSSLPSSSLSTPEEFVKNLSEGKSFEVREVAIRRWVPARMRG